WQGERDRFLLILFVFWLLLYAGRPTWGALINLLPLSRDLHLHRLIGGVHLGGIYLMGIGLAWLWEAARRLRSREQRFLVPALLTLALLIPAYRERYRYLWQNARSMVETANAVAAERQDLDRLFQALRGLPAGRVYAGLPARWGKDIKVGAVPLYALLSGADFDTVGYLYHALSLNADIMVLFEDGRFEQYDLFNVRYVITPQGWTVPSYYRVLGDFGRFRLYGVETSG
ncbi:MAG: hypothetical protein H5T71_05315, partial [Chloroflexi bacterium]|nr:hypothetical protein [Chloroflexota bacterium]